MRTTPAKLANDRYRGIGPKFVKHGRRVLYRWSDVHAWTEANLMQRTDDRPGAA
ncbi:DNA-binding protein [Rhodococcus sp. AH-ZY2]|uniref:DNA-binding protein n=1 Tax=Rhodococcus sp. AH-ZY2 TaxID=3047468 RepID=UPI0027E1004F|nr:DNA-binding protein [Rhodococcus sp. AH-ZY2]WML66095.1 DNA-binding protein [Rhodococcus sp. AH-ZY2]